MHARCLTTRRFFFSCRCCCGYLLPTTLRGGTRTVSFGSADDLALVVKETGSVRQREVASGVIVTVPSCEGSEGNARRFVDQIVVDGIGRTMDSRLVDAIDWTDLLDYHVEEASRFDDHLVVQPDDVSPAFIAGIVADAQSVSSGIGQRPPVRPAFDQADVVDARREGSGERIVVRRGDRFEYSRVFVLQIEGPSGLMVLGVRGDHDGQHIFLIVVAGKDRRHVRRDGTFVDGDGGRDRRSTVRIERRHEDVLQRQPILVRFGVDLDVVEDEGDRVGVRRYPVPVRIHYRPPVRRIGFEAVRVVERDVAFAQIARFHLDPTVVGFV
mmetsp:Transcript_24190/g.57010  ORF Transcript_24190/g.57010 Transcript_24190/m.57010 type:complete len:326 (+) Transcript_24190:218-1195(+)